MSTSIARAILEDEIPNARIHKFLATSVPRAFRVEDTGERREWVPPSGGYGMPRCTCPEVQRRPCPGCRKHATARRRQPHVIAEAEQLPVSQAETYRIVTPTWQATIVVNAAGMIVKRAGTLRTDFQSHQSWKALRGAIKRQIKKYTITRERT